MFSTLALFCYCDMISQGKANCSSPQHRRLVQIAGRLLPEELWAAGPAGG